MLTYIAIYLFLSLGMVVAMTMMILKIGHLLGDCPDTGMAARTASVTIATGYAMVAIGGVVLIGAGLASFDRTGAEGLLPGIGLAAICLGLGFTHAIATLREVVREAVSPPAPMPPATDDMAASAA